MNQSRFRYLLLLLAPLLMAGCSTHTKRVGYKRVSIIQLIATPTTYDGQRIQVSGFLVFEVENETLYLSPEDAANGISAGGIELNVNHSILGRSIARFNRKYISLIGTFYAQGNSQWPMKAITGEHGPVIAEIDQVRTPPYSYGPQAKQDQLGEVN